MDFKFVQRFENKEITPNHTNGVITVISTVIIRIVG